MLDTLHVHIENEVSRMLKNYINKEGVEFEIRLGWKGSSDIFDSNIGKHYLDHILYQLNSCRLWSNVNESLTRDVYYDNIRITYDNKNIIKSKINKTNLINKTISLPNTPFDLRISVNVEKNIHNPNIDKSTPTFSVCKQRKSFVYKMWSYDTTIVTIDDEYVKNDNDNVLYQFEIELIDKSNIDVTYLGKSIVTKIYDIINIPVFKST